MKWSDRRIHFSSIPPWPSRGGFLFAVTAALLLGQALGQAQDLRLTVKPGSPLKFTWRPSSVTLAESPQIIPDTQLETSADLKNWQPLGQAHSGGLDTDPATITQAIPPTDGIRYFRVRAQVNLPKANLAKRNLVGADLRGANLAGANLTNADLAMANLNGANLLGADLTGANLAETTLGNVDFTDADLTGAGLVYLTDLAWPEEVRAGVIARIRAEAPGVTVVANRVERFGCRAIDPFESLQIRIGSKSRRAAAGRAQLLAKREHTAAFLLSWCKGTHGDVSP